MARQPIPIVLLAALLVASLPSATRAADDFPLVPAVECRPRAGLPNFVAKASAAGADLRVAYLGGSITAQNGWRPKTLDLLRKTYPTAKFAEVNAAIGGTGSDLGVFRLKRDVLDHKPDLLFVEFAVNDGGSAPDQITRCMEGIVRQTWRTLPECDICFVYTLVDGFAATLQDGKFPRAASVMEGVADHYGIPSIHMGLEAAKLAKDGKLVWKGKLPKTPEEKKAAGDAIVFSGDGVHPYPETGHELYLAAVARSWPAIAAVPGKPGPHALKEPLRPDNYERAKLLPLDAVKPPAAFEKLDPSKGLAKQFGNRFPSLYKADKPGDALTFKFKGTRLAIYDLIGPDCGQVTVTLDDKPPAVRPLFDAHCTYHRLATLVIGSELKDEVHTVRIEVHPEQPDKAKILAQRNVTMDKPERFDGRAFYPAGILLVGELVE